MTRCSDTENDDQCDDGAGKPSQKRSKGGKRVSFPPDEQIVSGFAEHGSSDRTADSCLTLMEVTVAYQQSCSKHQVQPRERILHQLQLRIRTTLAPSASPLLSERFEQHIHDYKRMPQVHDQPQVKAKAKARGQGPGSRPGVKARGQGPGSRPGVKARGQGPGGNSGDLPPLRQVRKRGSSHVSMAGGERLDHRSCEALEVVFKSLRFDFINLQAAQLEENGAQSLLDMILYYESAAHLHVSDSGGMGTSGWRALAHLIKQSVCLSRLDVCNMSMVGYPAHSLSRALLTSQLRVLQLHNVQLSGLPLYTLVGGLKTNKVLQELHLTNNLLNSHQDALHLGDLLSSNSCLQLLELSNNAVADDGLEELCDGLRRQTAGLNVLLLRNNQITAKGMVHLAKALPSLTVLQVLDLGENHVGNKGVQVIREPLMMNGSLLQLGLAHASITCEGAVALAEFLAESHQIQRLDIRQNHVRTGGLMALCLALRINRSLASLDLDHEAPQEQICVPPGASELQGAT
ncbi:protein phosphatase 1 regulatory subunit 37 [Aulostomus maculatus]